jgi:hypothetical protein
MVKTGRKRVLAAIDFRSSRGARLSNGFSEFLMMTRSSLMQPLAALLSATAVFIAADRANAITAALVDDFEDGTVQGWGGSTVANVANAGPAGAGDNALSVNSPNRVVINNQAQWQGNYSALGIKQISLDVRHQNGFPLALRLAFAGGPLGPGGTGDTYVTDDAINVVNDGLWHHISFNVTAADFVATSSNTSGSPNATAALTNVTHLRLLHNPAPQEFVGASGPATFFLDNIAASTVPEPAATGLLAAGTAGLFAFRRAQRRQRCTAR